MELHPAPAASWGGDWQSCLGGEPDAQAEADDCQMTRRNRAVEHPTGHPRLGGVTIYSNSSSWVTSWKNRPTPGKQQ